MRSLLGKVNQLRLDLPASGIDVFAVSETWLATNIEERLTTVTGYNLIRHDRQTIRTDGETRKGGGLGVYHKEALDVDPAQFRHLNYSNNVLELQWVVISRPNTKKILMGNVYRPPDGNITEAFDLLAATMDRIQNINKFEVLLMGDFNADSMNKTSLAYRKIQRLEAEHQLRQMITTPTRYSKKSHTAIDLAFTNIKHCSDSGVINYNISDHKLIYINKKKDRNCKAMETRMGRSYTHCTHEILLAAFSQEDTDEVLGTQDPNECLAKLDSILLQVADRICPIKKLRIRTHTVKYLTNDLQ